MDIILRTCHLYRQCLAKLFPFSLLLALIYHAIRYGSVYIPQAKHSLYLNAVIVILILTVPLYGAMIIIIDNQAKTLSMHIGEVFFQAYQAIVTLFATLISIILLPAIIIGILFAIAVGVARFKPALATDVLHTFTQQLGVSSSIHLIEILIALLIACLLTTKIFAPFLVYTDQLDANSAIDKSTILVKHHYFRTLMFMIYNSILLIILWKLPFIISLFTQVYPWIWQVLGSLLLAIIGPWILVCMLVQQYELQGR